MKMKVVRRLISIFFVIVLHIGLIYCGIDVSAMSKNALRKKYSSKIKMYKNKYNFSDSNVYFGFYDINHDGVDECLIVGQSYSMGENTFKSTGGPDCAVYTWYKGKIKKVVYSLTGGGTWGGVYFSKGKKSDIVNIDRVGNEYIHYTFKKLTKGKLKVVGEALKESIGSGNSTIYKINKKKTTETKFETYCSKMLGNNKGVKLKKVTDQNLKNIN